MEVGESTPKSELFNGGMMFCRVNAGGEPSPWFSKPPHRLAKNLTVVVGVPRNPAKPVRVAFATLGGKISHADLEPLVMQVGLNYELVKAVVSKRTLEVLVPPKEDQEITSAHAIPNRDPLEILPESVLSKLVDALGLTGYKFTEDTRWKDSIEVALQQQAQNAPKTGIEHLRWINKNRPGD